MLEKPMQLQAWADANQPPETLLHKRGYWDQILFVRDNIPGLLAKSYDQYKEIRANLVVISEHASKSVLLPVFQVELTDGTVFTMRYNFYNWKVSVKSPKEVVADFMGLFNPEEHINPVYCEGFPRELVYGSYVEDKRQFTIELSSSNYDLYTFIYIFAHQVLGNRNKNGRGALP